jgi:uncharacterized membrane protein YdjX (TVP38/TMEM64 family)
MPPTRGVRSFLWIGVLLAIAIGAVLWFQGLPAEISDPERLAATLERAGAWGPIVFIAVAVAAYPVLLLGPPIWASVAIWPWPLALLYSYVGCIAASLVTYSLARWRGYAWAQRRVSERVRRYEDRLESRPFLTVLLLRLGLWGNPLVDLLVGVTKVPVRSYLAATFLGMFPATAFQIGLGLGGLSIAREVPTWAWAAVAATAVALVVGLRWRRARRQPAPEPSRGPQPVGTDPN